METFISECLLQSESEKEDDEIKQESDEQDEQDEYFLKNFYNYRMSILSILNHMEVIANLKKSRCEKNGHVYFPD